MESRWALETENLNSDFSSYVLVRFFVFICLFSPYLWGVSVISMGYDSIK